jgi:hypothetical protein
MSAQLPLPARWARQLSNREPQEALAALRRDQLEAKARIREVVHWLAERHGISRRDVTSAIEGYADDLLNDAAFHVEQDLEREIDAAQPGALATKGTRISRRPARGRS